MCFHLKQKTSRKFEKVRLLRQSPHYSAQQVLLFTQRRTKASIICHKARIHNIMDGESCDFRDEELLWGRLCTLLAKCLAGIPEKIKEDRWEKIKSCDLQLFILVLYILQKRDMEFWKLHKCGVTQVQFFI